MIVGVLISGNGSNLQNIINNVNSGYLPITIGIVISSSNQKSSVLMNAIAQNIPTFTIDGNQFKNKKIFEKIILDKLFFYKVDLLVLAGFMKILSVFFIKNFKGKIINIHPSLLPAYPGIEAPKQAIKNGAKFSGCTVHYVNAGIDTGKIISQKKINILKNDTPESLKKRILVEEHKLYPKVIKNIALKNFVNNR